MKIISIGDIHGKDIWRRLVNPNELNIFVGDYVDSFDIHYKQIIENLKDIINFKIQHPDNVILLWGNHDIMYALDNPDKFSRNYRCSGYVYKAHHELYELFNHNKNLFQLAYQHDNYLWTHAGVSQDWYDYYILPYKSNKIADDLNKAFKEEHNSIFTVSPYRGGPDQYSGPLWFDIREIENNKIMPNFKQIVGHTRQIYGTFYHYDQDKNTSLTCIDVLEDRGEEAYIINTK